MVNPRQSLSATMILGLMLLILAESGLALAQVRQPEKETGFFLGQGN